jgi:hypothetical protein
MAAGLSIDPLRIDEFRRALNRTLEQKGPRPESRLQIDGTITLPELTMELVSDLERLAPFGAGNPPLVLACRGLQLQNVIQVGREGEHLLATVVDQADRTQQVIWWQAAGLPRPEGVFDLAFTVRTATFQGQRSVQLEWLDYQPVGETLTASVQKVIPQVYDYRQAEHPLPVLKGLSACGNMMVWAEADARSKLAEEGVRANIRTELTSNESLAIWTPPPGPETLMGVLEKVRPGKIYLFAVYPDTDYLETYLRRLAGLVKYVIHKEAGSLHLAKLAGALAQRDVTIRIGLAWMEAQGMITCQEIRPGELILTTGGLADQAEVSRLALEVEELLAEARAYRTYFTRAGNVITSLLASRNSA